MTKERENLIQELPKKLYEAYELADHYAASPNRTEEMQDKIREKLIVINNTILKIGEMS